MPEPTDAFLPDLHLADEVNEAVITERLRAHRKFVGSPAGSREDAAWDDASWLPVLVEEVGEVANVLNERALHNVEGEDVMFALYGELVQVAAMATAWATRIRAALSAPTEEDDDAPRA